MRARELHKGDRVRLLAAPCGMPSSVGGKPSWVVGQTGYVGEIFKAHWPWVSSCRVHSIVAPTGERKAYWCYVNGIALAVKV